MAKKRLHRRDFLNDADELNDLSEVIRFHRRIGRQSQPGIKPFLRRFREVLARGEMDNGSLILQDHWALLYEAEGNIAQAIPHRELEVERIDLLLTIGGPAGSVNEHFLIQILLVLRQDYLEVGDFDQADAITQRLAALNVQ